MNELHLELVLWHLIAFLALKTRFRVIHMYSIFKEPPSFRARAKVG